MSLDIIVYCKALSEDLVPKIQQRLNEFDMHVEMHPDFKFDEEADTGFLPFRFSFKEPKHEVLKGKDLISGFEIYIGDFDLKAVKEEMKPKKGFMDKFRNKEEPEIYFASPEIEERLKDCKKSVNFVWHAADSFESRFAILTSAILSELTDGVCCYAADDIWYDNQHIVEDAYKEITAYEHSLKEEDVHFHEFDEW